jgi:Ala-tRNA(Pro) deacylase
VSGSEGIVARVVAKLDAANIAYQLTSHAPVFTSAEAAAVRGVSLHSGSKALVLKAGDRFLLAVLPADLSLDSAALRGAIGTRKIRFATAEELLELTGLAPGAVPPFGSLFGLETICDTRLGENAAINFNPGSHSQSLQMAYSDWERVESPTLVAIGR